MVKTVPAFPGQGLRFAGMGRGLADPPPYAPRRAVEAATEKRPEEDCR